VLAVIVGLKKFNQYICGSSQITTIHTDHQPLLAIFTKDLDLLSPHLQKFVLKSLPYLFKLVHRPGKELYNADALSRTPQKEVKIDTSFLEDEAFKALHVLGLIVEDSHHTKLVAAKNNNPFLQSLKDIIIAGFPEHKNSLPEELRTVWSYRNELYIDQDVIMQDCRIFVPLSLHDLYIKKSHGFHQGIRSTIQRVQLSFF